MLFSNAVSVAVFVFQRIADLYSVSDICSFWPCRRVYLKSVPKLGRVALGSPTRLTFIIAVDSFLFDLH